jgi:hypothetical protein
VSAYESLRTAVLAGCPPRDGIAALRYYGMLHGLAILLQTTPTTVAMPVVTTSGGRFPADHQFVRLVANIVLHTHAELMHVY